MVIQFISQNSLPAIPVRGKAYMVDATAKLVALVSLVIIAIAGVLVFVAMSNSIRGTGTLEGAVRSYGCPAIQNGEPCGFPAANYDVIIYVSDGATVFARTRTDSNGFYKVSLPQGSYVVYGDCHIYTPCTNTNGTAQRFTIKTGQVTELNITFDNDIR